MRCNLCEVEWSSSGPDTNMCWSCGEPGEGGHLTNPYTQWGTTIRFDDTWDGPPPELAFL